MTASIHQLDPEIFVMTPKGMASGFLIIDYGIHLNTVWLVSVCATGEILHVDSSDLKRMGNAMLDIPDPEDPTEE